ncbi:unnamed protein product [Miscanthus lutarioriparius]|uniref:Glucose-6-phosphate dehydrogenase C-terminal domain-containing protein n=1 Tax=Miscanthus lutarioriparius TaxID=422564 RepID=A0A811M9T9_9POAL|nr:unnamed protein product [Miscanthus lutarioriparius]
MSGLAASASAAPALSSWSSLATSRFTPVAGPAPSFRTQACGLRCWIAAKLKLRKALKRHHGWQLQRNLDARGNDKVPDYLEAASLIEKRSHWNMHLAYGWHSIGKSVVLSSVTLHILEVKWSIQALILWIVQLIRKISASGTHPSEISSPVQKEESAVPRRHSNNEPSLCIAVIELPGELARTKVFPALFALYYSGFLPQNVGIFGYSRKKLTDEGLRSIIEANLTCRVDHHENCDDKLSEFLKRTYYVDAGHDNKEGMVRLNSRMEQLEGIGAANRIFYLAVPQEALLDVALPLADGAQTKLGWNRIIIEKPFGFTGLSSQQSNLHTECAGHFSEETSNEIQGRYFGNYGIIRDIVHSHILQTIALFAMEPPVSLDGEDIRDEKVKVLRSIRKVELEDVVLGQLKDTSGKVDRYTKSMTPTYFAAAMYIDNARWDGVPFFVRTGMGLMKNRAEIRIQFRHVPGNIYCERFGHDIDLDTNELVLRDQPEEAILLKVNNKVPGLGLQLDASELNLLYRDRYNTEVVPDSYEHLLLDVLDGDSHLFMRSDELAAAWNVLTPIIHEIDQNRVAPELYEAGDRGPINAYYLAAKHGVRWDDDW